MTTAQQKLLLAAEALARGDWLSDVARVYSLAPDAARAVWQAGDAPLAVTLCDRCIGEGRKDDAPCKACGGSGLGDRT